MTQMNATLSGFNLAMGDKFGGETLQYRVPKAKYRSNPGFEQ
jgi:hypothetical protein